MLVEFDKRLQLDFGGVEFCNSQTENGDEEDDKHGQEEDIDRVFFDHALETEKETFIEAVHLAKIKMMSGIEY